MLVACWCSDMHAQQDAPADGFRPNSLAVAKIKLQNKDTLYALPGQALVVVSTDGKNVVVRSVDGKNHLRVSRDALVPINEAAPLYAQLIRATPTDPNLFVARANVYTTRGEVDKAIADLQQAIKLDDQYEAAYVSLAEAQMRKREYDAVHQTVNQVLKIDPKNPTYHVLRGVAFRHQEKFQEAINAFTEALKHKADHIPALSSRGFIYYLQREHAKAVRDFDAWVKLEPTNAMAVNNRGYNRQFTGDYQGALVDYNKAIELSPEFALAFQNKSWLMATCPDAKIRDGKEAFAAGSKACVLRNYRVPEDVKALAASYAELGDFQHAIEFQQKVVDAREGEAKAAEVAILNQYKSNKPFRFELPKK